MNTTWTQLTTDNVIWGLDPNATQMDLLKNLLSDEGFIKELETHIWWVKPNLKFYQDKKWATLLAFILKKFSNIYRILDAKCSDWINTEMWVINKYRDCIEAITIAPASWDDLSYIEFLQNSNTWRKVDVISMWAMSFPGTISDLILWSFEQQKAKITRNLEAWVSWVVMWATANNTDIIKELEKIKDKIKGGNIEYACLKWYTDEELTRWILLRNKLFNEVLPLIQQNNDTKILVPGFWRQWGSKDFFIPTFEHWERSRFNAWSDIIKGLENEKINYVKKEVIERLEKFLTNLNILSNS